MKELITANLDIWSAAITAKTSGSGRSSAHKGAYGINKLRELILELAVRGKLVPQDPNDEPARELLKRIASENNRSKRNKSLPPVADDEKSYALPRGWEWMRLGDVGETNIGLTYSPSNISDTGTPVLRSSNIQGGKIDLSDLVRVVGTIKESAIVKEGDLLICARNGSKNLVGKTALITNLPEEMAFGAFMAIFRSDINMYLLKFINSPLFRKMIDDVNTTTINQITQDNLKNTLLPLPPLQEQHRIVAKVDELMALCDQMEMEQDNSAEAHEKLVSILLYALTQGDKFTEGWARLQEHFDMLFTTPASIDKLKQALLQLAVMGKLVPQDLNDETTSELLKKIRAEKDKLIKEGKIKKDKPLPPIADGEKPFLLPIGWEWVRFIDIATIRAKLVKPEDFPDYRQIAPDCIEKGTGRITDIRTVKESGVRGPNSLFNKGQILYSKIRPSLSKAVLVDFDGLCSADMYPIDVSINSDYFLKLILSEVFLSQVRVAENRIKMPKLNQESLTAFVLPLPPIAEQYRIVAKVDELMALCDQVKSQLIEAGEQQRNLADVMVKTAVA